MKETLRGTHGGCGILRVEEFGDLRLKDYLSFASFACTGLGAL